MTLEDKLECEFKQQQHELAEKKAKHDSRSQEAVRQDRMRKKHKAARNGLEHYARTNVMPDWMKIIPEAIIEGERKKMEEGT